MILKAGARLRSQVCSTEVVVVRAVDDDVDLTCGGAPMVGLTDGEPAQGGLVAGLDKGSLLGKRYAHDSGFELLVSRAGTGSLGVGQDPLQLKENKPLPASD